MDKGSLISDPPNQQMKRYERIDDCMWPTSRLRHCIYLYLLIAIAAILSSLVIVPEGSAATATLKNAGAIVQTLNLAPANIGAEASINSRKLGSTVLSSQASGCCQQNRNHNEMPGQCQLSCPAPGCDQSAIQVWQSPAHAFLSLGFALPASGAPGSFLHQRINRPPITDRLAKSALFGRSPA